jgi:CRP-like cAMP-binding protein
VAGSNLSLKKGQSVFKEGDQSDGMYLVRKGEIVVYLEREGNIINLAKIGAGGMVGEMAFFEQKPRSASVRAETDCEISKISNQDFTQLMKQIPKWFVGLMTSLSGRLRDTNARLQKLEAEAKGVKSRHETMVKILHVLNLLWHKHGSKEGRDFSLPKADAEAGLATIFKLEPKEIARLFEILTAEKICNIKNDQYNKPVFSLPNRGALSTLIEFIEEFLKTFDGITHFPEPAMNMVACMHRLATEMAYETGTIKFNEVVTEAERQSINPASFTEQMPLFQKLKAPIQVTKASDGKPGFRVNTKELAKYLSNLKILFSLHKAGLDR